MSHNFGGFSVATASWPHCFWSWSEVAHHASMIEEAAHIREQGSKGRKCGPKHLLPTKSTSLEHRPEDRAFNNWSFRCPRFLRSGSAEGKSKMQPEGRARGAPCTLSVSPIWAQAMLLTAPLFRTSATACVFPDFPFVFTHPFCRANVTS